MQRTRLARPVAEGRVADPFDQQGSARPEDDEAHALEQPCTARTAGGL